MEQNEQTKESDKIIKEKIANKIYKLNFKSGKSRVWEMFGTIETDTGETIPKLVACKKCNKIYHFAGNTTSSLNRHVCYQQFKAEVVNRNVDPETKKSLEQLLSKLTIKYGLPINLTEDSDMKQFVECLIATGANYGPDVDVDCLLPQPATTLENLGRLHADYVTKLKAEFKSIRNGNYGLTVAIRNDENLRTSLFLTMHYVKNGKIVNRFLGTEPITGYKAKGEYINLATEVILRRFDCSLDDKPTLVTDHSEIMMGAFHANERLYCMNRLLQKVLEKAIDETSDVKEINEMSIKLVNFLKSVSKMFANWLRDCPTKRWYTILHILSNYWKEVVEVSESHKGEESCIYEYLDFREIKALAKVLEPFEVVYKELDCDDAPTLHLAVAHAYHLKKMCSENKNDTEMIKAFKVNLLNFLETYVWKNMTLQHKVALYLFPPANKMVAFSESDKDLVRAECQRIMLTFVIEEAPVIRIAYKVLNINDVQIVQDNEICDEDDILETKFASCGKKRIFDNSVESNGSPNIAVEKVNNEMRIYEGTHVTLCDGFNLLQWWEAYKAKLPLLYRASCKILATPATGAASERMILKAGSVIFEKKNTVDANPESVEEFMFLHCNVKKK